MKTAAKKPQTPEEVHEQFRKQSLAAREQIGPIYVEVLSLCHALLFEELGHPFSKPGQPQLDETGKPVLGDDQKPKTKPLTIREIAQAIYVFHDVDTAFDVFQKGGVKAVDLAAMKLLSGVPMELHEKIVAAIVSRFKTPA